MAEKIDWIAAKTEYITTDISAAELAEAYGVSKASVIKHSKAEGWVQARKEYKAKVVQKSTSKTATKASGALRKAWTAAAKLVDAIDREADRILETGELAAKDVSGLSAALEKLTDTIRKAADMPGKVERAAMQAQRDRLDIERQRLTAGDGGPQQVVVTMEGSLDGFDV